VNRLVLAAVLAGAAATAALLLVSWLTSIWWVIRRAAVERRPPLRRAAQLAMWRLAPAGCALAAALITLTTFLRFEPSDARENAGVILLVGCLAGAASAAAGLTRVTAALRQTTLTLRAWGGVRAGIARALPVLAVETPFPLVAVVGVFKPRLLVAQQVVAACNRAEIDAMVAHEYAHVAAGDNLTRLLFAATPVVPLTARTSAAIEGAWIRAAEEAADDVARRETGSPLALASALTKVARLARGPAPLAHASAILSGNGIEQRVRRLLVPPPKEHGTGHRAACVVAALAGVGLAQSPTVAYAIYELAEFCVQRLP
jgi:Zn-dependent protease with chaperone function